MFTQIVFIFWFICFSEKHSLEEKEEIDTELQDHSEWESHKEKFGLVFDKETDHVRRKIFENNAKFIKEHNSKALGFQMGHNKFSHMTDEEFLQQFPAKRRKKSLGPFTEARKRTSYQLKGVDWRTRNAVSPVKNQKHCGSCWAFSSVQAIESAYYIKYNKSIILSPQNLVDCSWEYNNRGCDGGMHNFAFKFVIDNGINGEDVYPYTAKDTPCSMKRDKISTYLSSHRSIRNFDEEELAMVVEEFGPVSVSIDAGQRSFRFYQSGIYYEPNCKKLILNHDVNVVGFGKHPQPHYIIRNSWSTQWGLDGYILMPWNGTNPCGVASDSMLPII